jgi:hypothetical protein
MMSMKPFQLAAFAGVLLTVATASGQALAIPHATTPITADTKDTLLQAGTLLRISLDQTLSSATDKVGDKFGFEVVDDVKIGDRVVVPAGTKGTGVVTAVKPAHGGGGDGMLRVTLDPVPLPAVSQPLAIGITHDSVMADVNEKNGDAGTLETVADAVVPGLFLLELFRKGSDVTLRGSKPFHVAVTEDTFIPLPK